MTALDAEAVFARAEQIGGWLPRTPDMETLYALARLQERPGGLFLEVGSWKGRSSYILAAVAHAAGARLVCLDTWHGYVNRSAPCFAEAEQDRDFIRHIKANLAEFGVAEATVNPGALGATVTLWPGVSWDEARIMDNHQFDLVFLDADHDSPGFDQDVAAFWPKVRHGGVLCGHDYGHPDFPDVKRVVDREFLTATHTGPVWYVWKV